MKICFLTTAVSLGVVHCNCLAPVSQHMPRQLLINELIGLEVGIGQRMHL